MRLGFWVLPLLRLLFHIILRKKGLSDVKEKY
jgi:hypothetical protein